MRPNWTTHIEYIILLAIKGMLKNGSICIMHYMFVLTNVNKLTVSILPHLLISPIFYKKRKKKREIMNSLSGSIELRWKRTNTLHVLVN